MRIGYSSVALISFVIRTFFIQKYWPIIMEMPLRFGSESTMIDVSIILISVILHAVTYRLVGIVYKSRSFPALGSFLYLVFYIANSFTLSVMSSTGWAWYSFVVAGLIYFLIFYGFIKIKRRLLGFE